MIIKSAQFIKGIVGSDEILSQEKPQIVFVGRSNVGKSSLINSLTNHKKLVKSSSTPGRTREINFFSINEEFYLVDLPGYGYAKISAAQAEKMRKMILWFLTESDAPIKKAVLIVDAKVGPKKFDLEMKEVLEKAGHDYVVVANKIDKLNQKEIAKLQRDLLQEFGGCEIVFCSTKTGRGREELWSKLT